MEARELLKGLSKLFLEYRGTLFIAAAEPGESSWGNNDGGMFTRSFLKAAYDQAKSGQPAWENILIQAQEHLSQLVDGQHLIYQINFK